MKSADFLKVDCGRIAIVKLNDRDFKIITRTAEALHGYHAHKGKQDFWLTFNGIKAEYAAIKFFNYELGCCPRIPFREVYENGGDGGVDFAFEGVTYDCKFSKNANFQRSFVTRTASQMIVFCVTPEKHKANFVQLLGYAPTSCVRNRKIGAIPAIDMWNLKKYYPEKMLGKIHEPRCHRQMKSVGDYDLGQSVKREEFRRLHNALRGDLG